MSDKCGITLKERLRGRDIYHFLFLHIHDKIYAKAKIAGNESYINMENEEWVY